MQTLFKPNNKGTGCLVDFSIQASRKERNKSGLYVKIVKQCGPMTTPFQGSEEKVVIKFNELEICSMLNSIERRVKWSTVHKPGDGPGRSIVFDIIYKKDEAGNLTKEVNGFSFLTSLNGEQFRFGLNLNESVLIREFFKFCLEHLFSGRYAEEKNRIKDSKKKIDETEEIGVELD